jgi:aminopeptidase N
MTRHLASVLLALALLAPALSAQPLLRPRLAPVESANPKPWELDPAPDEAAAKAAFYEKMTRWATAPTANQLALDARTYDLAIAVDPTAQTVTGTVQARFTVTGTSVSVADLNLANELAVDAVTAGGAPAPWTRSDELLTITLDRVYQPGETVALSVSYHGTPPGSYGAFGFDSHGGQPLIWTLSEPFGARSWWPCDDWSDDKADSVDLHVRVPAGLIVASNGTLRGVTHQGTTDTYNWHEGYAISTYLVSMAIHPYSVWSDYYRYSPTDSMEVRFYIYPSDVAPTHDANMMTVPMIAYYASIYGEYPFLSEKYGHAEFPWSGAMEHQTCTSTGAFYETIICHELAHQWWGDMVTCADFHHVWLNEGFATYSEALWLGHNYGPEGYWGKMNSTRYYGSGSIYVPDLNDWNRIFDSNLSYNKASWVLHMLRHVIGDAAFFQTLAQYRQAFAYGAARTEDFEAIAETVSGKDLHDFFQEWIYGEYYPSYQYQWTCAPAGSGFTLQLAVDQIQTNTGLFHMPIDIRVEYEDGSHTDLVIDNALAHQEYALPLPARATVVYLDPDEWILKRVQEPVVNPTFARGVLLVNGIDWSSYGSEMQAACQAHAFWGNLPISFWDCFPEPAGGYPSTLPAPLGHGRVPASLLGQFQTVIWLGNNYNGDLTSWLDTSILPYLQAGGNVLLMSRMGDSFLDTPMRDYLGISISTVGTIYDCITVHPPLTTIGRIGSQTYCAVFNALLTQPSSTLLYIADTGYNPNPGIGVWRHPVGGGWANPAGGHFAFLSGRPYRWTYADLSANVERIVLELFGTGAAVPDADQPASAVPTLRVANPALGGARIAFTLPRPGAMELLVCDAQGRIVRRLVDGACRAGSQSATWDGRSSTGEPAPSGIYYARLRGDARPCTAPFLLLR